MNNEIGDKMRELRDKREREIFEEQSSDAKSVENVIFVGISNINNVKQEIYLIQERNNDDLQEYLVNAIGEIVATITERGLIFSKNLSVDEAKKIEAKYKETIDNLEQGKINSNFRETERQRIEAQSEENKKSDNIEERTGEQEENEKRNNINKKRKPGNVIEIINPDKAKMDYWQTVKQAFNLPDKVKTIAFKYPVSSEEKVDYANITVLLIDKDGYVIDDLNVNDYFEFDSSTGNNPIEDNIRRHEEDENEGKTQIEKNRTIVRLRAKNSNDPNTFISLEQKNSMGDYNDINAGREVFAGTQKVEKQLETDHVRVWDSEEEKLMSGKKGIYNLNEQYDETLKHEEQGEDEYINTKDADGNENTQTHVHGDELIEGTNMTYIMLANACGYGNDAEHAKKVFRKVQDDNPDLSPEKLVKKIIEDKQAEFERTNSRNY